MKILLPSALLAALLLLASGARADVLTTKDGRRLEGKVISETPAAVRFKTGAGEVEIPRAQIESLVAGKTKDEELAEKEKAAKTAEDFFQAARFAEEKGMKSQQKRLMKRVLELDPKHAGANQYFGRVLYKGEWLEPADRDARVRADEDAAMLARGLVRWQDRWVTPDEKSHLEKGEEQVGGVWMSFADAQRTRGLEEHDGRWLPRAEAFARNDVAAAAKLASLSVNVQLGPDAIVAGTQEEALLAGIVEGLARGRAWFDATFQSKPGLELFGGRLAEFYLFESDDAYTATVPHFASLTKTVSEGWADAVKKTHGFLWWDPYPLSSARRWKRNEQDLVGHCYHHWGHLLLNRLGYDGRLLPPWFDEGVAATVEHRIHGRNDVFCRGSRKDPRPAGPSTGGGNPPPKPGTKVGKGGVLARTVAPFDPKAMKDGAWLEALKAGLGQVPPFDDLASLQFDELEAADIAAAMAIVQWIESRGPGSLRRFHDELRKRAPPQPQRVLGSVAERFVCYDAAFRAATNLGLNEADKAWREWTAKR
ncbi:MAG: hypothetical protein NTY35_15775 [Planctomycetota bacterium]|nr:hypothetical protein [Planctomycetota bacterium]